jgi:predicted RNA-binding protein YlxR (DUF448 family)
LKLVSAPLRTCVVCRKKTGKEELTRIVRAPTGGVEVDPSGRKPGRGVYLCHRETCWEGALNKKNRLEHSLRVSISPEERLSLREFAQHIADTSLQR